MMRNRGFTIIEMLAVVLLVGVTTCLLVACVDNARNEARKMQNNTHLRAVHQGMTVYARDNRTGTGPSWFPGLNKDGTLASAPSSSIPVAPAGADGAHPAVRFAHLLKSKHVQADELVAVVDDKKPHRSGALSKSNYSYAALRIETPGSRRLEWAETLSSDAVVLSDRNTGQADSGASSIWKTRQSAGGDGNAWGGSVVWNDNHGKFVESASMDTEYAGTTFTDDHLFARGGAEMVYSDSNSLSQHH